MEKQIMRWSYLLGVICVVVALLLRAADAAGWLHTINTRGTALGYMSFLKGALMFLVACIATSSYTASQKS